MPNDGARLVSTAHCGHGARVKTVELPDTLFRDALAAASERGVSLKDFLANAVRAQIGAHASRKQKSWPVPPPKVSKAESRGVQKRVAEEFGRIESENWR